MLITKSDLIRGRVQKSLREDAGFILKNAARKFSEHSTYDIFLSHSYADADEILVIREYLERMGFTTYVDWVDDHQLDRSAVTSATAARLKGRMKTCKSLFYVVSENSSTSKWMPWELGYFDALKNKVAILPVVSESYSDDYNGREYLGLYPYVTRGLGETSGKDALWVHDNPKKYVGLQRWLDGINPIQR